jgi:predicted transposase YdaD
MDEKHRTFLSRLLEYIIEGCNDIDEQDVEQAFLSIGSREAREAYMALAERLIEKGKREGKREGELEGKLLDRLDQALGLIFKAETIAEVLRPLD